MKKILPFLFLINAFSLSAQEKGATPLSPAHPLTGSSAVTRAVIIGISNYQDDKIPDLKYADRDALAFAGFLRSKAGGSLNDDHLKVLTNEQATAPQIYMALDWLLTDSKEGDLAIIYFSGHGDAEVKLLTQPGFLLTHESVAQIPKVTCLRLNDLENYIVTLSIGNKAKVLVVTDACRSGKLAGREGGSKMANTELAAMSEKAIKILSCQPDELSYEGEQWGGGRGAFSYFLVNGLYGLADAGTNRQVTLIELGNYIQSNVSREVAPESQIPKIAGGNLKDKLAGVFPDELAAIKKSLDPFKVNFKPIEQRGLEDDVLAQVDSTTREAYRHFKAAVAAKQFFEPKNASADTLYNQLTQVAALQPLYNIMKRNYAAALMDDAQEAMNGWLRSDPKHVETGTDDYLKFTLQLERAAELLTQDHYLYNDLKAKEYFFRARIQIVRNGADAGEWDSLKLTNLLSIVKEGLKYDDKAPYLYAKLGYYNWFKGDFETAVTYLQKAIDLSPTWIQAYCWQNQAFTLVGKVKKAYKSAKAAYQLDSTYLRALGALRLYYLIDHQFSECKKIAAKTVESLESQKVYDELWQAKGRTYYWNGRLDNAEVIFEHILLANKNDWGACFHLGWINFLKEDLNKAERWFVKGDSIYENEISKIGLFQITYKRGQYQLGDKFLAKAFRMGYHPEYIIEDGLQLSGIYDRIDEAILLYTKSLAHLPNHAPLHYHLARLHLEQKNDYAKGVPLLERAVQLDSTHAYAHYHLAAAYAHLSKKKAALDYLEKALENGCDDPEGMEQDERWKEVRGTKRYKELVKRYVPKQ